MGAVVVIDNRVIARTHNLTELLHDVTAHAEMQAITPVQRIFREKYLKDCTLICDFRTLSNVCRRFVLVQISKLFWCFR